MAQIGELIDGRYEILREIGRGGMSVVYQVHDQRLKKDWAIKEVNKNKSGAKTEMNIKGVQREVDLMRGFDHPNIVSIMDVIETPDSIFIIEDYVEGKTLKETLDEAAKVNIKLEERDVINWGKQITTALNYLHNLNPPIIYRDLKPSNVMLKPDGNIKLVDFGIAREYSEEKDADTELLGTQGYTSPEHHMRAKQTDARSDIFTLGRTLHHLITGENPRDEDYVYNPVRFYREDVSEGLEIIIDQCVELDSDDRYQNCEELIRDLENPEAITRDYKREQRKKLIKFLVVSGLAIIMLFVGVGTRVAGNTMNNNEYDALVGVAGTTSLEDKIDSYLKAIELYPYRTETYLKMTEAYVNELKFDKDANDQIMAVYNMNEAGFDHSSEEVAELNYKLGFWYFNYYTSEGSSNTFSEKVQKAFGFFENNAINEELPETFSNKEISECYYTICSFYKKYILDLSNVEEATKENYIDLLDEIEASIALLDNADAGAHDKLNLYNASFMLLMDQRIEMAELGVPSDKVLELMDDIYHRVNELNVKKEQSMKLKEEVTINYTIYRESIERAYGLGEV